MDVRARIIATILLISVVTAVPAGDSRRTDKNDDTRGLTAESSEITSEVVPPPPGMHVEPDAAATDDHTDHSVELVGRSQTFFPTFANLFEPRQQNNYRLDFGNNQEGAYSQRPNSYKSLLNYPIFGGYRNLENFGKASSPINTPAAPLVDTTSSVLGSGNFGIIRGGTFFAQNDEDDYSDSFNYYNNGHGRPSFDVNYIANPRPNYNQDQFANFRDFADINSPANSAYSHYVVVYANKNSTADEISEETRRIMSEPKNIIETLERLDEPAIMPKMSKVKTKLEMTKRKMINKKEQWKKNSKLNPKQDAEEPLLALS
ncbi:uncharacterized protein LOC101738769 [Bombyx mori]|uniref:Uncharacterized protein n=1 Tax=Bombyx mori TaxID=7091 RepID=A0A8R1WP16_BOMMO|nr:uncharacterized protein LOC101738769 [Bombyx mori]